MPLFWYCFSGPMLGAVAQLEGIPFSNWKKCSTDQGNLMFDVQITKQVIITCIAAKPEEIFPQALPDPPLSL